MKTKKVSYLGPYGSFSHEAAISRFPNAEMIEKPDITAVFNSVFMEEADFGVLPVENSTEGIISLTYHLLVEQKSLAKVKIVGEIYHPIHHNLAAVKEVSLGDIKFIHTKQEAWEQCRLYSRNLSPNVTFIPELSTSEAAAKVASSNDPTRACISSMTAIKHYKLTPIAKSIQDIKDNTTRFLILGLKSPTISKNQKQAPYKISFGMILQDRIGAIADAFSYLAKKRVDVRSVKISPVRAPEALEWKDWFFVDVLTMGQYTDSVIKEIENLKSEKALVLYLLILGYYPSGRDEDKPSLLPYIREIDRLGTLSLEEIVASGEGQSIEFKSTLRWNIREKKKDNNLESAVVKTIAGFMNAQGGILLIGVDDTGNIIGLENDYNVLHKPSKDGFEQHIRNLCERDIGRELGQLINIRFLSRSGKEICVVTIQPSPRPVWIREKGEEEFYLRIGNRTSPLSKREIAEYIRMRWSY